MSVTKDIIKQLIAQDRLDEAIDILLKQTNMYLSENKDDKFVCKISDALLINSGKLKGLIHDQNLGILSPQEAKITKAEVQRAILYVIDQLPGKVFQTIQIPENTEQFSDTEQNRLRQGVELLQTEKSDFEFDLFLSFSSKDREEARKVWEKLRGFGLRVFLSDEALKIDIGTSFTDKIQYALANSQHLVLIFTPNARQSRYVKIETDAFFNQYFIKSAGDRRRLIILKGKDFEISQLPIFYQTLQLADNTEQIVNALVDKVLLDQKEIEKEQQKKEDEIRKRIQELEATKQSEREELEREALEEIERKQKEEQQLKQHEKEETELKHKLEEELKAKEQAELKRKQEEERKAKEQAELKHKQDEERKAKKQAKLKRKQEAERKAKEQAELNKNFIVTVDNVSFEMIFIKGGELLLRNPWPSKEEFTVRIPNFYLGKFTVTNELWIAVKGEPLWKYFLRLYDTDADGDLPVTKVDWYEASDFINELINITGKSFRLPSESEWEFAAKGGNLSKGYKWAGSNDVGEVAWYYGNTSGGLHPVGQKKPNELGIYDMSGNVWEWVEDNYHKNFENNPDDGSPVIRRSSHHVLRGGGFKGMGNVFESLTGEPYNCKIKARLKGEKWYYRNTGFRLALSQW